MATRGRHNRGVPAGVPVSPAVGLGTDRLRGDPIGIPGWGRVSLAPPRRYRRRWGRSGAAGPRQLPIPGTGAAPAPTGAR
ncbi:hypothetical protein EK904_013530 [Melospiza melodia maxima]|nr:hypothetical protein EK904_013530 [Melospiza melodia maxima]